MRLLSFSDFYTFIPTVRHRTSYPICKWYLKPHKIGILFAIHLTKYVPTLWLNFTNESDKTMLRVYVCVCEWEYFYMMPRYAVYTPIVISFAYLYIHLNPIFITPFQDTISRCLCTPAILVLMHTNEHHRKSPATGTAVLLRGHNHNHTFIYPILSSWVPPPSLPDLPDRMQNATMIV